MKTLLIIAMLLMPVVVFASPTLTCDPYPDPGVTITTIQLEMDYNGVVTPTTLSYVLGTFGGQQRVVLMDLAGRPNGIHKFRARWTDANGWWSDWSEWYPFAKPVGTGNPFKLVP